MQTMLTWSVFAETVTYSIVTILVAPQPTQGVPQPSQEASPSTSGVYRSNPAVVAEYGMFVHIVIVTSVNQITIIYMYICLMLTI